MDPDLFIVLGSVLAAFSIPAVLLANIEGRSPWASVAMTLVGGCLIFLAVQKQPSGFELTKIPDVFVRVIARFIP